MSENSKTSVRIDTNTGLFREDESPWYKEFTPQPGIQVLQWKGLEYKLMPGVPKERVTILDVLRTVYSAPVQQETRENKSKKHRLLTELNKAARKKKEFVISAKDADFTLDEAAKANVDNVGYGQLEDLIEGRALLGMEEEIPSGAQGESDEQNQNQGPSSLDAGSSSGGGGQSGAE